MNKLKGMRVYLSGSIDKAPDYGLNWRRSLEDKLKDNFNVKVINPLNKPIKGYVESIDSIKNRQILKACGDYDTVCSVMKLIRKQDLRLTDISDFCICYLDLDIQFFGTIEEIVTMNRSKKPILVIIKQGKVRTPDWLFGMIGHKTIFNCENDLLEYLKNVDTGQINDSRWVFIDL